MGSCHNDQPCQMEVHYETTFSSNASDIICYLYTYGLGNTLHLHPKEKEENLPYHSRGRSVSGRFPGIMIQDPNVSNFNMVHVTIFRLSLLI